MEIRYIRNSMNGSTDGNGCQWVEIKAFDYKNINIAFNKKVSSSFTIPSIGNVQMVTDGVVSDLTTDYVGYKNDEVGIQFVQIDLGALYDIHHIEQYHYIGKTYKNMKLEVSSDNVNWVTMFDSEVDGRYVSTLDGKTMYLYRPISVDSTVTDSLAHKVEEHKEIKYQMQKLKTSLSSKGVEVAESDKMSTLIDEIASIEVEKHNFKPYSDNRLMLSMLPALDDVYTNISGGALLTISDDNIAYYTSGQLTTGSNGSGISTNGIVSLNLNDGNVVKNTYTNYVGGSFENHVDTLYHFGAPTSTTCRRINRHTFSQDDLLKIPFTYSNCSSIKVGNKIYLIGGSYNQGIYCLDLISDTFTQLVNLPSKRYDSTLVYDNKTNCIYILGGTSNGSAGLRTVWAYDIDSNVISIPPISLTSNLSDKAISYIYGYFIYVLRAGNVYIVDLVSETSFERRIAPKFTLSTTRATHCLKDNILYYNDSDYSYAITNLDKI